jgi:prevent-host-death family protein
VCPAANRADDEASAVVIEHVGRIPGERLTPRCTRYLYYIGFMSEVPVRELNQNTAGVLARVKRGEAIDVTERGAVIARLVPAEAHPLAELMGTGRLRPATVSGPAPRPGGPVRTQDEAGELVRRLRDDERC